MICVRLSRGCGLQSNCSNVVDPALAGEMTANIEEMDRMVGQFLHYVRANYNESPGMRGAR